jgi:hypothetical protein
MHTTNINKNHIIEIRFDGDLTTKNNQPILESVVKLSDILEGQANKVNILIDFTNIGRISKDIEILGEMGIRDIDIQKVACFGAKSKLIEGINNATSSVGKKNKFKFFKSRQEAERWLLE